jgi:outer membrane murein-binding lipoprotein Lpp
MNRIAAAVLATVLLAGCAAPSGGDWRYSEVTAAVDNYRREQPAQGAGLPQRVRSIRIDAAGRLTVYLSDSPGLEGTGCELKLERAPSGAWVVTGSRFFQY